MDPLPMSKASCSLNEVELGQQLERYRAAGAGSELIESDPCRRVVRVAPGVPEAVIEELIEVERDCCPFFKLSWDRETRRLAIAVEDQAESPALDVLAQTLGVG
jgi:hypothetical protein